MAQADENNDEFEYKEWPKTIEEAVELVISSDDIVDQDFEMLCEYPKSKLDKLHSDFGPTIRKVCDLDNNTALREVCGSIDTKPNEASRIILEAVWNYLHDKKLI